MHAFIHTHTQRQTGRQTHMGAGIPACMHKHTLAYSGDRHLGRHIGMQAIIHTNIHTRISIHTYIHT